MTDRELSMDDLRATGEIGESIANEFEPMGITSFVFAAGDDEPCGECGLRVYPSDPRYATSAAHEATCSSYLWDQKR